MTNKLSLLLATAALILVACGSPNKTNIRSKENVQCKPGEVMICKGATPTRLEQKEPDGGEFCTCERQELRPQGT